MGIECLDQLLKSSERVRPIDIDDDPFACTSVSSFCRAGRSIDPPEKPPK